MKKAVMILLVGMIFFAYVQQALSVEVRHRTFTPKEIEAMENTQALIRTVFGDITLRFFPDVAPNHVDNFISLAEKGFYNDTIFHGSSRDL